MSNPITHVALHLHFKYPIFPQFDGQFGREYHRCLTQSFWQHDHYLMTWHLILYTSQADELTHLLRDVLECQRQEEKRHNITLNCGLNIQWTQHGKQPVSLNTAQLALLQQLQGELTLSPSQRLSHWDLDTPDLAPL